MVPPSASVREAFQCSGCAHHTSDARWLLLQVEAKLAAAASCCHSGVLAQLNQQLLERLLTAVRVPAAAAPGDQTVAGGSDGSERLTIADMRAVGAVMKVQN